MKKREPSEEQNLSEKDKSKRNKIARKACFHCQKSHRKCDDIRPCMNCTKSKKNCYDVENKIKKKVIAPKMNQSQGETDKLIDDLIKGNLDAETLQQLMNDEKLKAEYIQHLNNSMLGLQGMNTTVGEMPETTMNLANIMNNINYNNLINQQRSINYMNLPPQIKINVNPLMNPNMPPGTLNSEMSMLGSMNPQIIINYPTVHLSQNPSPLSNVNVISSSSNPNMGSITNPNNNNMNNFNNGPSPSYNNLPQGQIISNNFNTTINIHPSLNNVINNINTTINNNISNNITNNVTTLSTITSPNNNIHPLPSNMALQINGNLTNMPNGNLPSDSVTSEVIPFSDFEIPEEHLPFIPQYFHDNPHSNTPKNPSTKNTRRTKSIASPLGSEDSSKLPHSSKKLPKAVPSKKKQLLLQLQNEVDQLNEEYESLKKEMEFLKSKNTQNTNTFEKYCKLMFPSFNPNLFQFFQFNHFSMFFVLSLPLNLSSKFYHANFMYLEDVSQDLAYFMGYSPSQVLKQCCSSFVPPYSQTQLSTFSTHFAEKCKEKINYMRFITYLKNNFGLIYRVECDSSVYCQDGAPSFIFSFIRRLERIQEIKEDLKSFVEIMQF